MLQKIERPTDSFLTHFFARKISTKITPHLVKTKITPLQITICGLFLCLTAAKTCTVESWTYAVISGILFEIAHILDCIDGELARLTDRGSTFAAAMDPITDRIKDAFIIYAAHLNAIRIKPFNLSEKEITLISMMAISSWMIYIYIVDVFLNNFRKQTSKPARLYFGMYDIFVYSSVVLLFVNKFFFFNFLIAFCCILAIPVQILRLNKYGKRK